MKPTALYRLAKEIGVTSKEAMALLKERNMPAKQAISMLTPEQTEVIRDHFTKSRAAAGEGKKEPTPVKVAPPPAAKPAAPVSPAPQVAEVAEVAEAPQASATVKVAAPPAAKPAAPVSPAPLAPPADGAPQASATVKPAPSAARRKYTYRGPVTLSELAKTLNLHASGIIMEMLQEKNLITLNQRIGIEVVRKIGEKFNFDVSEADTPTASTSVRRHAATANLKPRAPVVTIMGHVDHGKTSLLDAIRKSNVAEGETGGITQHISAFKVAVPGHGDVVFLDTPGHEAFTAMRARGANATDLIILVVAADDGVMPQTIEAINHARAAKVPIVVAINKIDKPEANIQRVKQELISHDLTPEEWGGKTIMVEVSALKKTGLDKLLEMLLLEAELLELKADASGPAEGTVLEARMHKARGPLATILIQHGTLKVGDIVTCGIASGRVRKMLDDKGASLQEAGPATPVDLLGLSQVAEAGARLVVVGDERIAREATERHRAAEQERRQLRRHITLQDISQSVASGEIKELRLILKTDVQGSLEALSNSISRFSNDQVRIVIIHQGVGAINSSDIALAAASDAVTIGFHVGMEPQAQPLARQENVEVRLHNIIYAAVDEIKKAMEGLLKPRVEETPLGRLEVRATFRTPRGLVVGCFVVSGKAVRGEKLRVTRNGELLFEGSLNSLRRFKEDVREVGTGYECGVSLESFDDFKTGDIIDMFTQTLVQEKLRV